MSEAQVKTGQHQRRFARANVELKATYERSGAQTPVKATVTNLGGGGMRLASAEDLPRDEILTIHFSLPNAGNEMTLRGKVVMSFYDARAKAYSHGIAFTQAAPADQKAMVAFVESIDHEPTDG